MQEQYATPPSSQRPQVPDPIVLALARLVRAAIAAEQRRTLEKMSPDDRRS